MNPQTSWTLIQGAAAGKQEAREDFSRRYLPVVRAYLAARWRGTPFVDDLEDAVQEVFLDCFRLGGVLERADPSQGSGFRAFLFGVVRKVALHVETRRARERERRGQESFQPEAVKADEASLSRILDQAWARSVVREAEELQAARAREKGEAAEKRVELLRLRFEEDLPIREIAQRWGADPARLHHEYAQARKEFLEALREVIRLHERCPAGRVEEECQRLLQLLE